MAMAMSIQTNGKTLQRGSVEPRLPAESKGDFCNIFSLGKLYTIAILPDIWHSIEMGCFKNA
jgi:hypothetical protein